MGTVVVSITVSLDTVSNNNMIWYVLTCIMDNVVCMGAVSNSGLC